MAQTPDLNEFAEAEHTLAELLNTSFMKCESCSNIYTSPLLLPCLHTFCAQCITDTIARDHIHTIDKEDEPGNISDDPSKRRKDHTSTSSSFVMHCPTCMSRITIQGGQEELIGKDDVTENCDELGLGHEEATTEDKHNRTAGVPVSLYEAIKTAVALNLPKNNFLESIARLYRHRNDSGRLCAYCKTESVNREATSLCLQCNDDVCDECAGAHRKTRVTREHSVIPYGAIQDGLFDHDIRTAMRMTCEDHPDVRMTHFCKNCLTVVCKDCRSKNHHGHTLLSLKEACAKMSPEIQRVHQGLTCRVPDLSRYVEFLANQLTSLDMFQGQVRDDINSQTERIHQMLDEWKIKVLSKLDTAVNQEKQSIEETIHHMNTSLSSLKKTAFFLLHLSSIGKPEEKMGLYAPIMERYQQMLQTKPKAMSKQLKISFNPGPATDQNIQMLIGKLSLKHEAFDTMDSPKILLPISSLMPAILQPPALTKSWLVPSSQPQPPPGSPATTGGATPPFDNHSHHRQNCFISGIDIKGNMVAVVDRENARVVVADKNSLNVLKIITGEGDSKLCTPFDIVFLPSGALAVTDTKASVVKVFDWTGKFIFNFKNRSEKLNQIHQRKHQEEGSEEEGSILCLKHPRGITLNKKKQVVVVDGHLKQCTVHDSMTGQILKTIQPHRKEPETQNVDNNQHPGEDATPYILKTPKIQRGPILVNPFYVSCTPDGNLVITDAASPNVKILRSDGLVLEECVDYGTRADESLHPFGVCTDKSGYILLADTINSRIQLGLPDGQFSSTLVSSKLDPALSHPLSVCLDEDDQLVVAQAGGKVNWYKYL